MGNQTSSSRTDTVVKLVLIFFIALLSFSVGTFVGKQVSDSDHRAASLEKDYKSFRDVASVDKDSHKKEVAHSAISTEEVNNLTDEFVNAEKEHTEDQHKVNKETDKEHSHKTDHNTQAEHTVAKAEHGDTSHKKAEHVNADGYKKFKNGHKEPEHTKKPGAKQHDAKTTSHKAKDAHAAPTKVAKKAAHKEAVSHVAKRVAHGKAPTKTVKKKRLPSSILPSVATSAIGKYTVQVASYATESEAKTHAANLKWQGYSAFYIPANIKGKKWFRVSVGLFANQKSASNFRVDFLKQSGVKTAIIQKIVK